MNKIIQGDCLKKLKDLEDNSIDAVVTDPPYGLSFMGKKWDYDVPSVEIWQECLRVLKPGGYLLAFAGTRTQHRMAVRIEDAGFEIRDMIAWVYGSGFPKSLNIGKAVDKLQGNEREVVGKRNLNQGISVRTPTTFNDDAWEGNEEITKGTSEWEGWGTALKPALEPITVARKPLSEKTVAENVLKWGTGGINIDGSRVGTEDSLAGGSGRVGGFAGKTGGGELSDYRVEGNTQGRFPANFCHDGSDEVVELFPNTKSTASAGHFRKGNVVGDGRTSVAAGQFGDGAWIEGSKHNDSGSAARFFYCAKASKSERNRGCEGLEEVVSGTKTNERTFSDDFREFGDGVSSGHKNLQPQKNNHPTVKPIALMEYLVRLVSKEDATVLDPFAGSGSTLIACKKLGRKYIGIEREEEYVKIAEARLNSIPDTLL
jgi:site-specific DNA-methyltransferase (adenine-specific)